MKPAFLVSDEDIKSLRTQPWFVEMHGEAVFLHESILKVLDRPPPVAPRRPANGAERSLLCDQSGCPRSLPGQEFPTYGARQTHRSMKHGIPGLYADKHVGQRHSTEHLRIAETKKLPSPSGEDPAYRHGPSYQYKEFDAKGICGLDTKDGAAACPYKNKDLRSLHFHRSVIHGVRGVNHKEVKSKKKSKGIPGQVRSKWDGRLKANKKRGRKVVA